MNLQFFKGRELVRVVSAIQLRDVMCQFSPKVRCRRILSVRRQRHNRLDDRATTCFKKLTPSLRPYEVHAALSTLTKRSNLVPFTAPRRHLNAMLAFRP